MPLSDVHRHVRRTHQLAEKIADAADDDDA
jgi:hypothetical protein